MLIDPMWVWKSGWDVRCDWHCLCPYGLDSEAAVVCHYSTKASGYKSCEKTWSAYIPVETKDHQDFDNKSGFETAQEAEAWCVQRLREHGHTFVGDPTPLELAERITRLERLLHDLTARHESFRETAVCAMDVIKSRLDNAADYAAEQRERGE